MRTAPRFAVVAKGLVRPALWFCVSNLLAGALAAQCTDVSQVPNQTISSGTVCYSNNDTLTAAGVTINGSASVTFVAGHTVHLTPGFRATAGTAGTTFHAWVETAPSAISVSPSSGSGLSQQFTWTVSSPAGYGNIAHVFPLFNTSASGAYGCYIYYSRGANALFLANDAGTVWTGGFYPGTSSAAANSYCAIFGAGSSVSTSGNQLSLTVSVAFSSPAFSGTKNSYLNVYDNQGLYSGWQQVGTWTVPGTQQYYLTTAASPSGGGTIGPPSGWYNSGAQISVAAAPAAGYTFTGFSGNLAGTALPQILVMNGNKSVTANFTATPSGQYSLTTSVNTAGRGTITPGSGSFSSGQQVQVTASVAPGYTFAGFTGDLTGTVNPRTVVMDSNKSVAAGFVPSGALVVSCLATPAPASVGQTVTYVATVSGGSTPYTYSWSGAVAGSSSSASFVPGQAGGYQARVTVNQTATAYCSTAVAEPALEAFRNCIGLNGTGATCQLAPGTYEVPPPFYDGTGQLHHYLEIGRSGITITGSMSGGPADTILRRGTWIATAGAPTPPATYIMRSAGALTGVTVSYLTFDGNRYGAGLNCLPGNASYYDLNLDSGAFTVQWVDFINAPGTALVLGGNSTVSLSNFGQGGSGIGPSLIMGDESPAQTATRSTAIWIDGSDNGAWYNAISYAGTAGITLNGARQYAYGNLLYSNRYEVSDGSGGGQIFVSPDSHDASVAGNVIDGGNWPPPPPASWPPQLATGCPAPAQPQYNAGVEGYGLDHRFYNNEIVNNTGNGMQFAGSERTERITISSANPWDASDTPRFIEHNGAGGIAFLGPEWCTTYNFQGQCQATSGVTLDAILVRDNGGRSVFLDGVSNNSSYTGFVNGSCISGNHIDGVPADIPSGQSTLTYPVPGSYDSIRGGACPVSAWPQLPAPASSHIPGWPW